MTRLDHIHARLRHDTIMCVCRLGLWVRDAACDSAEVREESDDSDCCVVGYIDFVSNLYNFGRREEGSADIGFETIV